MQVSIVIGLISLGLDLLPCLAFPRASNAKRRIGLGTPCLGIPYSNIAAILATAAKTPISLNLVAVLSM